MLHGPRGCRQNPYSTLGGFPGFVWLYRYLQICQTVPIWTAAKLNDWWLVERLVGLVAGRIDISSRTIVTAPLLHRSLPCEKGSSSSAMLQSRHPLIELKRYMWAWGKSRKPFWSLYFSISVCDPRTSSFVRRDDIWWHWTVCHSSTDCDSFLLLWPK